MEMSPNCWKARPDHDKTMRRATRSINTIPYREPSRRRGEIAVHQVGETGCATSERPYNCGHAASVVGETRMDRLGRRLDSDLLETLRNAKLPLCLRSGEFPDPGGALDREPADFFLAGQRL